MTDILCSLECQVLRFNELSWQGTRRVLEKVESHIRKTPTGAVETERIPGGNPALTLSFPPNTAGDRTTTPGGIGWAKDSINSKALVPLSGQLGDGQVLTTSLCLSQTNQAAVSLTAYKNKSSCLGGIIDLPAPATFGQGAVLAGQIAGLKWTCVPDASASRWVSTITASALADSLGHNFRGLNVSFIAPIAGFFPNLRSMRDNFGLLRITPTNAVPFKAEALRTSSTFTGTLKLEPLATKSIMSGVFLQDESFGSLIGQGLVRVPVAGSVRGSFQTTSVELENERRRTTCARRTTVAFGRLVLE